MQRSAKLIDDATFITAQQKVSMYPFEYHTALPPNAPVACTQYAGGCKQFRVTGSTVDTYNKLLPGGSSKKQRAASTELFGGPFKARGDGPLMAPDALSAAWTPAGGYAPHCAKKLSEVQYDRYNCAEVKLAVELGARGGVSTRQGLQYITRC